MVFAGAEVDGKEALYGTERDEDDELGVVDGVNWYVVDVEEFLFGTGLDTGGDIFFAGDLVLGVLVVVFCTCGRGLGDGAGENKLGTNMQINAMMIKNEKYLRYGLEEDLDGTVAAVFKYPFCSPLSGGGGGK